MTIESKPEMLVSDKEHDDLNRATASEEVLALARMFQRAAFARKENYPEAIRMASGLIAPVYLEQAMAIAEKADLALMFTEALHTVVLKRVRKG